MGISVVTATSDLHIDGKSLVGCPLVVRDGVVYFVPSRWLMSLWRPGRSRDTVRTYAQQIRKFLSFLDHEKIQWWETNGDDIESYQSSLYTSGLKSSSINLAVQTVDTFYRWCHGRGYIFVRPFVVRAGFAELGRDGVPAIKPIKNPRMLARYLQKAQFDAVLAGIPRESPALVLRSELMFECARYMGLRRQEVVGLTVSMFNQLDLTRDVILIDLPASITKGNRLRTVPCPPTLVRRIQRYARLYRDRLLNKQVGATRTPPSDTLFLTNGGTPVTREYLSATWNVAAHNAGLSARFHSNRHWFGMIVTAAATRHGFPDPLRITADLMGHSDTRTTMIYAHASQLVQSSEDAAIRLIRAAWASDGQHRA